MILLSWAAGVSAGNTTNGTNSTGGNGTIPVPVPVRDAGSFQASASSPGALVDSDEVIDAEMTRSRSFAAPEPPSIGCHASLKTQRGAGRSYTLFGVYYTEIDNIHTHNGVGHFTQDRAQACCAEMGGRLASVSSYAEQGLMQSDLAIPVDSDREPYFNACTAGSDADQEGVWRWKYGASQSPFMTRDPTDGSTTCHQDYCPLAPSDAMGGNSNILRVTGGFTWTNMGPPADPDSCYQFICHGVNRAVSTSAPPGGNTSTWNSTVFNVSNVYLHPNGLVVNGVVILSGNGTTRFPVGTPVVAGEFRLSGSNYATLLGDPQSEQRLRAAVRHDLARMLGVPLESVSIGSLSVGSLIVEYTVNASAVSVSVADVEALIRNGAFNTTQGFYQLVTNSTEQLSLLGFSAKQTIVGGVQPLQPTPEPASLGGSGGNASDVGGATSGSPQRCFRAGGWMIAVMFAMLLSNYH